MDQRVSKVSQWQQEEWRLTLSETCWASGLTSCCSWSATGEWSVEAQE